MFFRKQPSLEPEEEESIITAIESAEDCCLAEIRVHLDNRRNLNVYKRAQRVFRKLKMNKTEQRNGILFYVVPKSHKYVILGDVGIHEKVGDEFWHEVSSAMKLEFENEKIAEGIVKGIDMCGLKLKKYFPIIDGKANENELPNEISKR